jgi:2-polyprenyl-3-methyl-5-hydroxy-6-metoxy-1,4-benzoquinol methylase
MSHSRLQTLALALNTHLAGVRRHVDDWDEERLRRELALAAALVDEARGLLDEPEIARQQPEAARRLEKTRHTNEVDPAQGYALWSQTYHEQADNPLTVLEEPVIEPLFGEVAGRRVLDVGCGTGRHALRLAASGAEVVGYDPCPEMLAVAREQARRLGLKVHWQAGGFGELPRDGRFDLVLCNLVLCHLPDIVEPVAEMAACLKPGGRLIISDFHYMCLVIGWRTAFDHEGRHYHIENYQHSYGDYLRAFQAGGLRLTALEDIMIDERLRGTGMESVLEKWEGFPFGMVLAAEKGR